MKTNKKLKFARMILAPSKYLMACFYVFTSVFTLFPSRGMAQNLFFLPAGSAVVIAHKSVGDIEQYITLILAEDTAYAYDCPRGPVCVPLGNEGGYNKAVFLKKLDELSVRESGLTATSVLLAVIYGGMATLTKQVKVVAAAAATGWFIGNILRLGPDYEYPEKAKASRPAQYFKKVMISGDSQQYIEVADKTDFDRLKLELSYVLAAIGPATNKQR